MTTSARAIRSPVWKAQAGAKEQGSASTRRMLPLTANKQETSRVAGPKTHVSIKAFPRSVTVATCKKGVSAGKVPRRESTPEEIVQTHCRIPAIKAAPGP